MIDGGDTLEFATQVCESMITLYKNQIDKLLPNSIDPNGTVLNPEDQRMREAAVAKLSEIMQANGADYGIIADYLNAQQRDSNNDSSNAMRYFLLTQRQDGDAMENNYYLARKTRQDLETIFNRVASGGEEQYAKSAAMYKAFTAIGLNKINFEGKNANQTCNVSRGTTCEVAQHSSLESTSIGSSATMFSNGIVQKYEVPFSNVFTAFFLSPEMCSDRNITTFQAADEREFMCNLNGCREITGE
jgi:hypothetical protein